MGNKKFTAECLRVRLYNSSIYFEMMLVRLQLWIEKFSKKTNP